jgi:hypothetical protein
MSSRPSRWKAVLLGMVLGLLLAAPIALLRTALRPEPWTARNLRVRFESVRYERAGLVFTYTLDNRTRQSARLLPNRTTLRVMQHDEPLVGYPMMQLPLDIQAHESRRVELRLELVLPREQLTPQQSAEQTARVLQNELPGTAVLDSPLSRLPMTKLPVPPEAPKPVAPDRLLANALTALDGFELVDASHGIRIVFPRGW